MSKERNFIAHLPLTESQRDLILQEYQPKHPNVYAFHVTLAYNVPRTFKLSRRHHEIRILGRYFNDEVDALLVSIDRKTDRDDGKKFHITLSVADGVPPATAGQMRNVKLEKTPYGGAFYVEPKLMPRQRMIPERV